MSKENIVHRVDKLILQGGMRVLLNPKDYQEFRDAIEPIYKKQWGGFLSEQKATEDGYENILYSGRAVCLDMSLTI